MSTVSYHYSDRLSIAVESVAATTLLTVDGVLDHTTYVFLRDEIISVALEEPLAVIVEATELIVPAESALSVFTSARWHVPDVA